MRFCNVQAVPVLYKTFGTPVCFDIKEHSREKYYLIQERSHIIIPTDKEKPDLNDRNRFSCTLSNPVKTLLQLFKYDDVC